MASRTAAAPPQEVASAAKDATAELLGDPVLGAGYDRIVSRIFRIDPLADFELVERSLEAKGSDFGVLVGALDNSETAARAAHRLLVNAQLAYEETKLEVARIESPLREGARRELEKQKAPGAKKGKGADAGADAEPAPEGGSRTKTITNADVESAMAQLYPEDIAACRRRLLKAKGTVEHLERMADLAKSRIRTLDTLVSTARH